MTSQARHESGPWSDVYTLKTFLIVPSLLLYATVHLSAQRAEYSEIGPSSLGDFFVLQPPTHRAML